MDGLKETISSSGGWEKLIGLEGFPADTTQLLDRKSCCSSLYSSQVARLLLGDTLHPGGLALTHRLGKLADIQRDDLVLDAACGPGAGALAVSRSFHCRVVGVDLSSALAEANHRVKEAERDGQVSFLRGDAEMMPLAGESFDAALCECSMSLFPDKRQGVAEIARLLRSACPEQGQRGGRLGVSDVTVEAGCLPDELKGTLGQVLCLADALSVEGYRALFDADGLTLIHQQDASEAILKLLGEIEGKLAAFRLLLSLPGPASSSPKGQSNVVDELISQALPVVEKVKGLVKEGGISYWLFVAEKTGAN